MCLEKGREMYENKTSLNLYKKIHPNIHICLPIITFCNRKNEISSLNSFNFLAQSIQQKRRCATGYKKLERISPDRARRWKGFH